MTEEGRAAALTVDEARMVLLKKMLPGAAHPERSLWATSAIKDFERAVEAALRAAPREARVDIDSALRWVREERIGHAGGKWTNDKEDAISAHPWADGPDGWRFWLLQYLDRAKLLGLDTPRGLQALGKFATTAIDMLASIERVYGPLPAPGLPSGEIAEWARAEGVDEGVVRGAYPDDVFQPWPVPKPAPVAPAVETCALCSGRIAFTGTYYFHVGDDGSKRDSDHIARAFTAPAPVAVVLGDGDEIKAARERLHPWAPLWSRDAQAALDAFQRAIEGRSEAMWKHYEALAVERAAETAAAEARGDRLRDALQKIARDGCENYTSRDCWWHKRTAEAEYTADRACDSCIANRALGSTGDEAAQ